MKNHLIFIFFLTSLSGFGQAPHQIDSLKSLLDTKKLNATQVQLHLDLSKLFENKNRDSGLYYAKNAELLASHIKEPDLLGKAYLQQGFLYFKQHKDALALPFLDKIDSLNALNKLPVEVLFMSKVYRSEISKFTFTMEGVLQAKEYLLQAQALAEEENNEALMNLAKYRLAEWHGFISQEVAPQQHLDTARHYILSILPYYQSQNNYDYIARMYHTLSSIEMSFANYTAAKKYDEKRLQTLKKTNDSLRIAEAYYSFGSLYRKLNQPDKGLSYLDSAAVLFKKTGFWSDGRKKDFYKDYAYLYEAKKDYKNAFENMYQALVLKDTIFRKENEQNAMELEKKYQTQNKEQEITLLKTRNELIDRQKKIRLYELLGVVGIGLITVVVFLILYRNKLKTTRKLKELDRAKTNFFANISHEFRTPLTLISGPVQQQLKDKNISENDRLNFEMIQRNADRLLALVDQLLDISKIEAGSLALKIANHELASFLGTLTEGFQFAAKQKQIKFTFNQKQLPNTAWFDKDVLEKITTNLLSNAIKYTPLHGEIVCTVLVEDNQLHFEVKNTGAGLSTEELEKVFERFYQLDTNEKGAGIGLALVKELTKLHRGTITAESTPNQWTTFKIIVPIHPSYFNENELADKDVIEMRTSLKIPMPSETEAILRNLDAENDFESQASEMPILLLVDDNADVRNYVSSIFKDTYTILQAKNGQEGIELAIEHVPDIIICDIMMPVKNGIKLCNTLKKDERTSHIPIILLTAKAGEENEMKGLKTGADDYVTKPFHEDLLLLKVQHLVEIRKKLQQRYSQEIILKPSDIAVTAVDEIFLERVQALLDKRLFESSFHIDEFSKAVGMSRMQLHRKLKALTGLSASEFIRNQRLKLAAELLQKSDANISQICYGVGFNDPAYFSKCFKELYHCTPTEFTQKK